jgi:cytochrome P450
MNYQTPNLVSMLTSRPHSVQKRMLSHVYSKSYIQHSPDLAKLSQVILARWASLLSDREELIIPVLEWNRALGSDFTSAYLFGCKNGTDFLRDSEGSEKFFESWIMRMKGLAGVEKAKKEVEAYLMNLVRQTEGSIQTPRETKIDTKPVVYEQFSKALEKSGLPSSEKKDFIIASEMFDQFLAGTETSKVTLTYLQYELSGRPELQHALRDELLTLFPSFKFPISTSRDQCQQPLPDPKALDDLPMLDAILKETLRLYTPSPPLLTRIVPKNGTFIDGYEIPGATIVGTTGYAMHMNEDIFPDAKSFKPERWLVEGARKIEMMRWFWAFGSGGRMCIGSNFAIYSELSFQGEI